MFFFAFIGAISGRGKAMESTVGGGASKTSPPPTSALSHKNIQPVKTQPLKTQPPSEVQPTPLPYMTVKEINQAYAENTIHADALYKNQKIRVKGVIGSVDRGIFGDPYLTLESNEGLSVVCSFAKSDVGKLTNLKAGQPVGITGICKGKPLMIAIDDCMIETH